ncbi:MAG: PAS domain S-box protein [Terricaulis sp.]
MKNAPRPGDARGEADKRFLDAINNISDAFYAMDETWRIVAFNKAAEGYFGFGPERVVGKIFWDIFPQGRGTDFGDTLERVMRVREPAKLLAESSLTPGRSIEIRISPWGEAGICVAIDDLTEQQFAERQLRRSEERLRLATEGAGIGAYDLDMATGTGVWSESAFKILGLEPTPDLRGSFDLWRSVLHPDDRDRVEAEHNAAAARSADWRGEYRVIRPSDGAVRWIENYGRFIRRASGTQRSVGVASDITERRIAEDRLRESEERFRTLYNSIEAGFYIAEVKEENGVIDYRYLEANPALHKLTGLNEIAGRWRRDIAEGAPDEFWYDLFARVVRTQTSERVEQIHEGFGRWFDVYAYPIGAPQQKRVAVLFTDITDRKQLEIERKQREEAFVAELEKAIAERTSELAESEARLRAIFESSNLHLGLLSLSGDVLYVNTTALKAAGKVLGDVEGEAFADAAWFGKTEDAPARIRRALAQASRGNVDAGSISLTLPHGARHFEFAIRPVRNEVRAIAHLLWEAVDVTERVEAEKALRQAQKLEAMGQLTGGVAHDFNNLLMIISGGLNMLERRDEPARREMLVTRMREAVERGAKLTQQLLAFSRKHDLAPSTVDFKSQIEAMRELLDRSLGGHVRVALDLAPNLSPIFVDQNALQQAILNLCVNARDAMPDGGVITIRAFNGAPDDARAPSVSIAVIDNGVGMSSEVQSRIFEPFFTTKEIGRGTGLGLAQVHGFAQQSGGRIEVVSAPGQGSTMTLVFPKSEAPQNEDAPANDVRLKVSAPHGGSVLLVEDDDEVASFTAEMLRDLGYDVTRAASGEEALKLLGGARAFDVVFSDIMMPGGMTGLDMAALARARRPSLPILLTSGYAAPFSQDAARRGLSLLPKPFTTEALSQALEKARAADP